MRVAITFLVVLISLAAGATAKCTLKYRIYHESHSSTFYVDADAYFVNYFQGPLFDMPDIKYAEETSGYNSAKLDLIANIKEENKNNPTLRSFQGMIVSPKPTMSIRVFSGDINLNGEITFHEDEKWDFTERHPVTKSTDFLTCTSPPAPADDN